MGAWSLDSCSTLAGIMLTPWTSSRLRPTVAADARQRAEPILRELRPLWPSFAHGPGAQLKGCEWVEIGSRLWVWVTTPQAGGDGATQFRTSHQRECTDCCSSASKEYIIVRVSTDEGSLSVVPFCSPVLPCTRHSRECNASTCAFLT